MYNFELALGFDSFGVLINNHEELNKADGLIEPVFTRRFLRFDRIQINKFPLVCIFKVIDGCIIQWTLHEPDEFAIKKFHYLTPYSSLLDVNNETNFSSLLNRIKNALIDPQVRYAPRKFVYDDIDEDLLEDDFSECIPTELPF